MRSFPLAPVLAVLAMILGLLAMLDLVKGDVALGLAIVFLALAVLLPGVFDLASGTSTERRRI